MAKTYALFEGADAHGTLGLWTTDGTAAGTQEVSVAGAASTGLFSAFLPADFTQLGSVALFTGTDSAGGIGLWVTDGTTAGTQDVTVACANAKGLRYGAADGYGVLGGTAYFAGVNGAGASGLWSTQGTSASTGPVSVSGGNTNNIGVDPTEITAFADGSRLLFAGLAASLTESLFVVTAGGASEINGAGGTSGFQPYALGGAAAIGNVVVFGASTNSDQNGTLWASDGTAAGTQAIGPAGLSPNDITSLGTLVLFQGTDATRTDLWVTDGTSGGTHVLAVAGASSGGLLSGVTPQFTRLDATHILFVGVDAAGSAGLWTTDGTAAGTHEITVPGANANGLFGQGNAVAAEPRFTLLNGRILFGGLDASGKLGLWSTDGTSAGTQELSVANAGPLGVVPGDLTAIVASDGTGTGVTCFAESTRIATPDGARPVEHLRPGDLVLTLGGARTTPRAVRWVGRFEVDLRRHPAPHRAAPIRIRAGAFAEGVPVRDVRLSPDHAVLFQGALIHAHRLCNGGNVVQEFPARVTYWHVELEEHAILLAEGLPAESYLDLGNRGQFDGEAGTRPLHPDLAAATWDARACATLVLDGPLLDAARNVLAERICRDRTDAGARCSRNAPAAQRRSGT